MGLPTITAEIAFASDPGAAAPVYTNVSDYLLEMSMKRGRTSERDRPETGVMNWSLRNPDRRFDPEHTGSPYYPNVDIAKRCRYRATWAAVTYDLFTGDAEEFPQSWQGRVNTVPLSILDGFDALNSAEVSINRSIELSGARLAAILDAASWPAGQRSLDTGQSLLKLEDDLTNNRIRNALEMSLEVMSSEQGIVFVNGAGWFVFHDRHRRLKPPYTTSQVTLSNQPVAPELPYIHTQVDRARNLILNDIAVQIEGGATYRASDSASQAKYRKRSDSVTVILSNPAEGQDLANYLLATYKLPVTRVKRVVLEPQMDDSLWPHALGREIGDKVTIEIFPPGGGSPIVISSHIEGIEHRYTVGRWTTTWHLSNASQTTYWVLGVAGYSELGQTTRLGF